MEWQDYRGVATTSKAKTKYIALEFDSFPFLDCLLVEIPYLGSAVQPIEVIDSETSSWSHTARTCSYEVMYAGLFDGKKDTIELLFERTQCNAFH